MAKENKLINCNDKLCPTHGQLSTRGRTFKGVVITKHHKRISIGFERTLFVKKYERYSKRKTKIHARLPDCMEQEINIGDTIEIRECRPISKMINFVVIKKINSKDISK